MKVIIALAMFFAVGYAAPVASELDAGTPSTIQKRDTPVIYLANCADINPKSEMIYYPSTAQGNSNTPPQNQNVCVTAFGSTTTWEGNPVSCKFNTGVTFTSHINFGAQSVPLYTFAGTGNNDKNWNCYKDNQRLLWTQGGGTQCKSIYYCLPA